MPDHPDMQRMQQEAVRRAMEMQSRARPGPEIRVLKAGSASSRIPGVAMPAQTPRLSARHSRKRPSRRRQAANAKPRGDLPRLRKYRRRHSRKPRKGFPLPGKSSIYFSGQRAKPYSRIDSSAQFGKSGSALIFALMYLAM